MSSVDLSLSSQLRIKSIILHVSVIHSDFYALMSEAFRGGGVGAHGTKQLPGKLNL